MTQAQAQTGAGAYTEHAGTDIEHGGTIPEKPGYERVRGRRSNWYYRRVLTRAETPAAETQRGAAAPGEEAR